MPVREVRPTSSGVMRPAREGSLERTSALSKGVTVFIGSLFSCPGVTLRPRLAWPRGVSPGSGVRFLGLEKTPKNSRSKATPAPTSKKRALLLSRPSSWRPAAGFCCRRARSNAVRKTSRQFPLRVSSRSGTSFSVSDAPVACAESRLFSASSLSMVCCLPQGADSKTNRC